MILYHTASNDFSSEPLSITIPSNAIVGQYYCFNLQSILFDDDIIEDTESFIVTIQETYPSITIEPGITTVYITDNDGACGLSSFQHRLVTSHIYSFEDNGSSLGGGTARGTLYVYTKLSPHWPIHTVQVKIKFPFRIRRTRSTLRSVIMEITLEPCHLHLVLSTCLIALVVVAVNQKNIIVRHVDNTK